jgi:hypothetical protein
VGNEEDGVEQNAGNEEDGAEQNGQVVLA